MNFASENRPKINLEPLENRVKIESPSWTVLDASWERLGRILGRKYPPKKTFLDMGTGSAMKLTSFKQKLELQTSKNRSQQLLANLNYSQLSIIITSYSLLFQVFPNCF